MSGMFFVASAFNGDIAAWNVSSVTDMRLMFADAYAFNQNIGAWNVGSVTDMSDMFAGAFSFNQNIAAWNVDSVTNMAHMFYKASSFNQDLCAWKNRIPFIENENIFAGSGCNIKTTPTTSDGPFCAVATCLST